MNHFERDRVVRQADCSAPGNPPDRRKDDDESLRCPCCRCITDDGEECAECAAASAEMRGDE